MSAMPSPVQQFEWETEIDRVLVPNGRYRFAVIVPASWSDDQTQTYLESVGWNVVSIGAPPPDVMLAISGVLAETGLPSGTSPIAFWVIATWTGASVTLAQSSGQLYYASLDYYAPVTVAQAKEYAAETSSPPIDIVPGLLAFAGGGLMVGAVLYASKNHLHSYATENPIPMNEQIINVNIAGKRMPVRLLEKPDGSWAAGVRLTVKRKIVDVIEKGSTKEEALHKMLARASNVVVQANPRKSCCR
jgi:hypothetical protein